MQLDNYIDVPTRLRLALTTHPELRILEQQPEVITIGDRHYVQVTVTVYRSPDDPLPCTATAWEPWPGRTSFTKESEMMNCSTSALGRALGFMGFGLTTSLASRDEVAHRQPEPRGGLPDPDRGPAAGTMASQAQLGKIAVLLDKLEFESRADKYRYLTVILGREITSSKELSKKEAHKVIEEITAALAEKEPTNG